MTVSYKILARDRLVYFHFAGLIRAGETGKAFADLVAHPDYDPALRQFSDFTDVTGVQLDSAKAKRTMQASASELDQVRAPLAAIFLAPTPVGQSLALLVSKLWQDHTGLTPTITKSAAEALTLIGAPERDIAHFLKQETHPSDH